tara:strand:- start:40 stop:546 length:507 start_codon:yes stop_codon:yes gene_type:complete
MKKLFTILMLIPVLLFGQLEKNNVYAEAHVGIISQVVMNYERQIYSGEKVSWYGRLGGGYGVNYSDGLFDDKLGWGGLAAISLLTGKKNNHFELNVGAFLGFDKLTDADLWDESPDAIPNQVVTELTFEKFISPILNIGYRYQKPDGGFIFRANAGIISLGLSIGYAF